MTFYPVTWQPCLWYNLPSPFPHSPVSLQSSEVPEPGGGSWRWERDTHKGGWATDRRRESSRSHHQPYSFLRADPASRLKMEAGEMGPGEEVGERRR